MLREKIAAVQIFVIRLMRANLPKREKGRYLRAPF
jgi:hypothetical protein